MRALPSAVSHFYVMDSKSCNVHQVKSRTSVTFVDVVSLTPARSLTTSGATPVTSVTSASGAAERSPVGTTSVHTSAYIQVSF